MIDVGIERHDRQDCPQSVGRTDTGEAFDSRGIGFARKIGIRDYQLITMTHRFEMSQ